MSSTFALLKRERFRNSLQTKVFNTLQNEFCTAPLDDNFLEDNRKQRKLIKIPQLKNRETNITTLKKNGRKMLIVQELAQG